MTYVETVLEELLYDYVMKRMTQEEQRQISSSWDILKHLEQNPDEEEDIQYRIFRLVQDKVNWSRLIHQIETTLEEEAIPESDDSESEEDNEDND